MDRQDFRKNALRTEPDVAQYEESGARLVTPPVSMALYSTIHDAIKVLQDLDQLKKHIFYGRESNLVNAYVKQYEHFKGDKEDGISKVVERMGVLNDVENIRILHGVSGIATESGELLEALAKLIATGSLDGINIGEEVGDVNWYEEVLGDTVGFQTDDVNLAVIKKLQTRFPHKFTGETAINRDVESERKVLDENIKVQ